MGQCIHLAKAFLTEAHVEPELSEAYEGNNQPEHISIIGSTVRQELVSRFLSSGLLCIFFLLPLQVLAQEEKIKVGLLMINADAGMLLALEKGYFRDQNLTVELNYFGSSG